MPADAIVLHGHAYQPPREDPRTGIVPIEPSAHPFHDWNERITAECYRPNAFARIYDGSGRIVRIVNNFERMSFDLGPTLARWLAIHEPEVHDRIVAGDRVGRTAIAHPFHHSILPLSPIEDARTELRWGIADFEARFGRHPEGVWFPETALDERTLGLLPELGIDFTIVAPYQVQPAVPPGAVARWMSPAGSSVEIVAYDGAVSHDLAFGSLLADTGALLTRMAGAADSGVVVAATDAETFGHHHRFTERGVAHALFTAAAERGLRVGGLPALLPGLRTVPAEHVPPSAWSCAHGLGRWQTECGCSTDGQDGWNQAWRGPLRRALEILRNHAVEVFVRRGTEVFHDPWAARDDYGLVLARPDSWDDYVARHVRPLADEGVARVLLESQAATLASFTSCAWFFADIARREAVIVLQEAHLSVERLRSLGEEPPVEAAVAVLGEARSNVADPATGREVWEIAIEGDGVLPNERARWNEPPVPTKRSALSGLLAAVVDRAVEGSQEAADQAVELVDVAFRGGTPLAIERVQERVWAAMELGLHPVAVPVARALGFAIDG